MNDRLKNYLALTAGFVAISPLADAQIIYIDANPDMVLTGNEAFALDLNNDGIFDFKFVQETFSSNSKKYYGNKFKGLYGNQVLSSSYSDYSMHTLYKPKPLNFGDMISNSPTNTWKNGGKLNNFQGLQDKYVGFRFKLDSNFYYGWTRFDVESKGKSITIKDYAYESKPNQLIKAGVSKVSLPDDNPMKNIRVYVSSGSIRIEAPVNENLTGTIRLSDVHGREQRSIDVKNEKNIELNTRELPGGVYIVNIQTEKGILNKKVLVR